MQVRTFCLVICLLASAIMPAAAQTTSTTQYIDTYKTIAMEEMRRTGVPAAIKLAQGILETQSGNGWLVLNSNNHFGIKCKNNWTGETVRHDDDARQECFRKYATPEESWKDHSDFLRTNPRYKFLFDYDPSDYKSWAYGLKTAGYATARTYPQQLIQLIENYQLQQYTTIALNDGPLPESPAIAAAEATEAEEAYEGPHAATTAEATDYGSTPVAVKYPQGGTEFKINGRRVMVAQAGTALIQIADAKNIRLSTLLKYNDLTEDVPLEKDMLIFLQNKEKEGKNDYHIAVPGETMHDISQAEGVQLRWLLRRNKMIEGEEPAVGEKIVISGYASVKPKLGSNSFVKPDDHKDLEPRKIVQDIRNEIEKASQQQPRTTAQAQPQPERGGIRQTQPQPEKGGIPQSMVDDLNKIGTGSKTHMVAEKETLYGISKRYNVTVAQLKEWNGLGDNGIKIGQQLIIRK